MYVIAHTDAGLFNSRKGIITMDQTNLHASTHLQTHSFSHSLPPSLTHPPSFSHPTFLLSPPSSTHLSSLLSLLLPSLLTGRAHENEGEPSVESVS